MFAEVAGVRTTTGRFVNRRLVCRSCSRMFFPYLAEVLEDREARKARGEAEYIVGDPLLTSRFAACPACGATRDAGQGRRGWWDAQFVDLRVRPSKNLCDTVCAHATGADCKCSCLGMNHGASA